MCVTQPNIVFLTLHHQPLRKTTNCHISSRKNHNIVIHVNLFVQIWSIIAINLLDEVPNLNKQHNQFQ